jgi:hypothetical protein
MPLTKDKTLYYDKKEGLTLWMTTINPETGLFEILISDRMLQTDYRVAEFDGRKYTVLNERVFDGIFYRMVKENPSIMTDIRDYIASYKPQETDFKAVFGRLSNRFNHWKFRRNNAIKKLWQPKNIK